MSRWHSLSIILLTLIWGASSPAQTVMRIYLNGEAISYPVADIQKITFSDVASVKDIARMEQIVKGFRLNSNFPNPFNPSTTVVYELSRPGLVQVRILDVQGREVARLLSERQNPGVYSLRWNGQTTFGASVAAGVYFSQVRVDGETETLKMLLLK